MGLSGFDFRIVQPIAHSASEIQLHEFLTLSRDGSKWPASRLRALPLEGHPLIEIR